MQYENAEVLLTVKTEGAIALRGDYKAEAKTDEKTGKPIYSLERNMSGELVKEQVFNLRTKRLPLHHECNQQITLNNQFVKWAMSDDARPRKVSAPWWKKLSNKNRIIFHVNKYVEDMFGKGYEFTYTILE